MEPAEVLMEDRRLSLPCFRAFDINCSAHEKNITDTG